MVGYFTTSACWIEGYDGSNWTKISEEASGALSNYKFYITNSNQYTAFRLYITASDAPYINKIQFYGRVDV